MAAITFFTKEQLKSIGIAAFKQHFPAVDPTVFGTYEGAFLEAVADMGVSEQMPIQDLIKQLFPQTSEDEFLDIWGGYEKLPRNSAGQSVGILSQVGVAGTVVLEDTEYISSGQIYRVIQTGIISLVSGSVTSIIRNGTTAIATIEGDYHNLANNQVVTISGADQPEYNGDHPVVILANNQFSFQVSGNPETPATGTIFYSSTFVPLQVEAIEAGTASNRLGGASFELVSEIVGIDQSAIATFGGLSGGAEVETDASYRPRILESRSLYAGAFTPSMILKEAKTISGNTRVFVVKPTLSGSGVPPSFAPGQVGVYVLRDNDADIRPNQTILDRTKQAIIEKAGLTANTPDSNLYVLAPELVFVDFVFLSINPDTPTMRTAIINQIKAFFEDSIDFAQTIPEDSYRGSIQNSYDFSLGQQLISFNLSSPIGDIVVNDGQIAALRDISFLI